MSQVRVLATACVSVALAGVVLIAQDKQNKPTPNPPAPITIDIPGVKDGVVSLQTEGAWPLTIRALANRPVGIGTYSVPYNFPVGSQQAFIVFTDPDGCFSLTMAHDPANPYHTDCDHPGDETYVEFTPTINMANFQQYPIGKVAALRLGAAPTLWRSVEPGNQTLESVGPIVGCNVDDPNNNPSRCAGSDGVYDNYGYGASPNMPGLVILSDRGVGLVWDEYFNLPDHKTARNLAGLMNSIAWTLNDCIGWKTEDDGCGVGRTSVTAHMNVPRNLFTPVVRLDLGHGPLSATTGRVYQIDGGPRVPDDNYQLPSVLNEVITTVRVFIVSGRGPDVLQDMDGNGVVDSKDARLAGYKVLSGDKVFSFKTYHQSFTEKGSDLAILYDFDGNGMQGDIAPGGSGGVVGIPR